MTEHVKAVVKPGHTVHHAVDGHNTVNTNADGVVKMNATAFAEAEALGSARRPRKGEGQAPAPVVAPTEPAAVAETAKPQSRL